MYSVSDIFDLGEAHDLVLSEIKELLTIDDSEDQTMQPLECFDE
jgi:hypothetical protein